MIQAGSGRGGRGKDSHQALATLVCGNMKEAGTAERWKYGLATSGRTSPDRFWREAREAMRVGGGSTLWRRDGGRVEGGGWRREGGDGKSTLSQGYDHLGPNAQFPRLIILYAGECQPIRK